MRSCSGEDIDIGTGGRSSSSVSERSAHEFAAVAVSAAAIHISAAGATVTTEDTGRPPLSAKIPSANSGTRPDERSALPETSIEIGQLADALRVSVGPEVRARDPGQNSCVFGD